MMTSNEAVESIFKRLQQFVNVLDVLLRRSVEGLRFVVVSSPKFDGTSLPSGRGFKINIIAHAHNPCVDPSGPFHVTGETFLFHLGILNVSKRQNAKLRVVRQHPTPWEFTV